MTFSRKERGRLGAVLLAVGLATSATVSGCSKPDEGPQSAEATSEQDAKGSDQASNYDLKVALRNVINEVESEYKEYDIKAGIAVADSAGVVQAGVPGEEPTWSTVKVPIAIAALRDGASPDLVDLAIKESDNDAAYALWSHVQWNEGDASSALKDLLDDYGSTGELEEPFGYSRWLLKDQAVFGSHLPCIPEAEYVYDAMDEIVEWQDNGLDKLPNTRAKGGWGLSEEDNGYTHRQVGVRDAGSDGSIGLAIEATMPGESAEMAIPALNVLAAGVDRSVTEALDAGALTPVKECEPKSTASASATASATATVSSSASTRDTATSSATRTSTQRFGS
ncbi:S-adenosylmethionine synthetase [uncultured Corynebacterium sp.]|mgnify:CR=1 FL=1|uniref:S-adenosylmethionine synthetase n=1 Tax=uncultured Corynebacterium sp. TaxID=159447 RepID=UPI0025FE664E|nr:S-adenosylmethionine synthetase [uncultured Corynebacterium sp.]